MPINRRPARYLTSKRAHTETMTMLSHLHELAHENKQAQEFNTHLLRRILRKVGKMAGELERIETEVTEISGAVDSAIALLGELADLIRNNAGDPARLNKIADDLDAKGSALAAAVVANDPDIPPLEEPPVEEPPVEPVP